MATWGFLKTTVNQICQRLSQRWKFEMLPGQLWNRSDIVALADFWPCCLRLVSFGRKRQELGFEGSALPGTGRELAGCILKMVPCSIFTSSLFPARARRKQVYSHLSFSAVFSEATWRNIILLLQLLNISPGGICVLYRAHIFVWGLEFFFLSCQFVKSSTYREKAEPSQKRVKFKIM